MARKSKKPWWPGTIPLQLAWWLNFLIENRRLCNNT